MVVKPSEASGVKAAAHSDDSLTSATERAVAEVFAAVLNVQWVSLEDDIFALGGDSFEAVRVALELERRFQIEFPVELIESAGRVRDVAAWISARSPSHLPQTSLASLGSMALKTNWGSKSLFSGVSVSFSADFPLSKTSRVPRTSAAPLSLARSSARRAMMVACVVPQVPDESFLAAM